MNMNVFVIVSFLAASLHPAGAQSPIPCQEVPKGGCSICGDERCVTDPKTIVILEEQKIACGELEDAGYRGLLSLDRCSSLPATVFGVCKCMISISVADNSSAPTTMPTTIMSSFPTVAPNANTTEPTPVPTSTAKSTEPSMTPTSASNTTQPTSAPTKAPDSTSPTVAPSTLAPTKSTEPPSEPPTKQTDQPTSSPSVAPSKAPSLQPSPSRKRTSIGKIIARTIGWLILIGLSVLLFGAAMSNRYQIYYVLRGVWYTILQMECTRWIFTKLNFSGRGGGAGGTTSSLNEIIFDNNDLTEGLLMGDT